MGILDAPGLTPTQAKTTYARLLKKATLVTLGDSTNVTPGAGITFPDMAQVLTDRKIRLIYNAGIAGNTLAQMLARIQTDVIAYAPTYCTVLGGTNDIGNAATQAAMRTTLTSIYDTLIAAGIIPIACTITPRNADSDVAEVRDLNLWIKGNAATRGLPCIDINAKLANPDTGYYATGLNADSVHPNAAGAVAMGQALADLLAVGGIGNPQAPSLLPLSWNQAAFTGFGKYSQQFVVNPLMLDTNADGTPDNWSLNSGGSAVVTRSVVTDARFVGRAMKWVCTASPGFHTMKQGLNTPSWSAGDTVRLIFKAAFESVSGIPAGSGFIAKLAATGPGVSTYALNQWTGVLTAGGTFAVDYTIPNGTTALEVQLDAQLGGGTGTVYWGQVGVVNLTRLGLTTNA